MLTAAQFSRLFPFHVILDSQMRIVSVGGVLARICPTAVPGVAFGECFSLVRIGVASGHPFDREYILSQQNTLFVFRTSASQVMLRFQALVLDSPERFAFVGSPWVRKPNELAALGLVMSDFALHDSTVDLLQLIQTATVSVRDAKDLAARLELQRNDLEELIASANVPILGVDRQGFITEWNRASERLFGVARDAALGRTLESQTAGLRPRERVAALVHKSLDGRSAGEIECSLIAAAGRLSQIRMSGSPRHGVDGEVVGALLICHDITALAEYRKELEERVAARTTELSKANADLSRAMSAKDDFLSAMSHELRTPLNAVLGLSESLLEGVYGPLTDRHTKSLGTIAESGHHLLTLINDLLDIAKLGAGKMELSLGDVSVSDLCATSVRLVIQQALAKHISVRVISDEAVDSLVTDARRLKQVLVNLLSNAVKFTNNGGSVVLEVCGRSDDGLVAFTVHDTGIGISAEDLKRLFVPFTQIDSRLSRQYSGTGLGLTLVRRLSLLLGGDVSVMSEPGVGSRFTVTVPWVTPSNAAESRSNTASVTAGGESGSVGSSAGPLILVVDDDIPTQETVSDYLISNGYTVVAASNGLEGVRSAKLREPRLILMDTQMPGMNGLDATRELRAIRAFDATPIVALTSGAMAGDRERCLEAGANAYFSKPVHLKELLSTIDSLLKAPSARREATP